VNWYHFVRAANAGAGYARTFLPLAAGLLICASIPLDGATAAPASADRVFDVRKFGARADGKTLETTAIQSAINAANRAGGGAVLLPPGTYLSGSLRLKSRVELRLEAGATLLGSPSRSDYQRGRWYALLLADQQADIVISGSGTIDGQGRALAKDVVRRVQRGELGAQTRRDRPDETERPLLIEFRNCRRVKVSGVTLRDSSCWTQNYIGCEDLVIEGITVRATAYWNNDGIDISDCRNVRISQCDINCADDGICLKSGVGGRGCYDVQISDCRIRSSASALKFGTASRSGFRKIRAQRLTVYDTFRSAIALESVDGGVLEDVVVENVRATNTGNALFLRLGHRNTGAPVGRLQNVIIRDVKVEVPAGKPDAGYEIEGPVVKTPHNVFPSSIVGLPGHPISGILLEDIEISYPGGADRRRAIVPLTALAGVAECPTNYPEFSMFGELPAWGLYVRHAEGIRLHNFRVALRQPDFRPALVFHDVSGLDVTSADIKAANDEPVIVLQGVNRAAFKGTESALPGARDRIQVSENCSARILRLDAVSGKAP